MEKVKLKASDDVTFEVELSIVKEMETVQSFLDSNDIDKSVAIPLHNVSSHYLSLIIEYCSEHYRVVGAINLKEMKEFDKQFMAKLDTNELKELLLAVNYLDMKNLFEILCTNIADHLKDKSVEFVRNFFDIDNDYTPEEEAEYREKNAWAFRPDGENMRKKQEKF